ncbi:terminase large subunit [Lactobacillus phage ATCC8014]|uniref:Terminase, large subunit n=1 Tax=Lactobacillus phage ATCC8014 TaxID=2892340 RepID=K4ICY4_9CAUD|nr:terminase large subunit [Lactobacillus phage ATCC8014]AFU63009.1 terminase large subunit [Lactobacillus phage ATCC8014]
MSGTVNINLAELLSPAYYPLFKDRSRYLVYKGSRGSGKSYAAAIKVLVDTIAHPYVNWLVLRQYAYTNRDSTFATLKKVASDLNVYNLFTWKSSPLEVVYKPTGQRIFFRGMDSPLKITSITPTTGQLCRAWYEECYELKSLDGFNTVEESLRGELDDPSGYYQSILTFNPWSERHFLKSEFFDEATRRSGVYATTTTYKDNDHLNESYIKSLKEMLVRNPNRARVAVLGDWGVAEGLVFDGLFEERIIDKQAIQRLPHSIGLDFGFKHDPTAAVFTAVDQVNRVVYVYDEVYKHGLLTGQIAQQLRAHMAYGIPITADSAGSNLIAELTRVHGVPGILPSGKGKDSVVQGIQYMQSYRFVVDPRCKGLLEELNLYVYDRDKAGNWLNTPVDANNHAIDALRYAMQKFMFVKNGQYMSYTDRVAELKNLGL